MNKCLFYCPICKCQLGQIGKSFVCDNGHCFDIAKEGYVNLLTVDKKHSKEPGDNKEMVRARFDFLEKGYYQPLADMLADMLKCANVVLDAGCGSGFYSRAIKSKLEHILIYAVDISKEAVKLGAKRMGANYAVAGVFDLPFADKTFDSVLNVFSPFAFNEYARVLKDGGELLSVYPAPKHLIELKKVLYSDATFDNDKSIESPLFESVENKIVEYNIGVGHDDIVKLLEMTPYYYTTSQEKLKEASQLEHIDVTISFVVERLKKI